MRRPSKLLRNPLPMLALSLTTLVASPALAQIDFYNPQTGLVPQSAPVRSGRAAELLAQMRRVSNYMQIYTAQNSSFYDQEAINSTIAQLNQLVPRNPYKNLLSDDENQDQVVEMDTGGQNITIDKRVNLTVDASLTDEQLQDYAQNPPQEWTGNPGDISVITNNRNLYIVWGAGVNGVPIKDPDTGHTAVLYGHYHLNSQGDL